ncbi:unnamed protein product [Effrenium voratum]|uniref:Vms1-associating treble clef domain-containing protein n=1 Tax=Effrenium voratum TaxID=2562239 RepID=A0AA36J9T0_9DINO|nr:unnamed protein product [Effrenium voratum]
MSECKIPDAVQASLTQAALRLLWRQCQEHGDLPVELGCLAKVRRWPLSSLQNLHLNKEDAAREVAHLGRNALVAVTTPSNFRRPGALAALQQVAAEAKIHIVVGTLPPVEVDFETQISAVLSDLACGFPSAASTDAKNLWPGFVGEVSGLDLAQLAVAFEAQRRQGVPVLVAGAVSRGILNFPVVWRHCAFFDVPTDSPMALKELQEFGAFVGFSAGTDVAWQDYPGRRPLRTEPDFVEAVKACGVNALISSGLRFRTDLTAFGGPGLAHALDLLKHAGVSTENVWANALSFLSFPWVAPAKPEKVTRQIECHWCGTRKMEGEHFSKMGFDYCSPSCIAKHRRAEFDPTKVRSYQG